MRMTPLANEDIRETDDFFYHLTLVADSYRPVQAEEGQDTMKGLRV